MRSAQPTPAPRHNSQAELSEQTTQETWPQGVSHTPTMSIGSALAVLTKEFPAVRISKIRFLEEQGIVSPHRTASGYRSYSQADVERLRFALAAQRDSFLPLKVIRERLEELDRQGAGAPSVGARVVTEDGELTAAATNSAMTLEQLADSCGIPEQQLRGYVDEGLIRADFSGRFAAANKGIVRLIRELSDEGVDLRHLKGVRSGAERQVELIRQLTAPVRSRKRPSSSAAAAAQSRQLAKLLADLYTNMLEDGVDRL